MFRRRGRERRSATHKLPLPAVQHIKNLCKCSKSSLRDVNIKPKMCSICPSVRLLPQFQLKAQNIATSILMLNTLRHSQRWYVLTLTQLNLLQHNPGKINSVAVTINPVSQQWNGRKMCCPKQCEQCREDSFSFAFSEECGADWSADARKTALRILGLKKNSVSEACFQITLASCRDIAWCSTRKCLFLSKAASILFFIKD